MDMGLDICFLHSVFLVFAWMLALHIPGYTFYRVI